MCKVLLPNGNLVNVSNVEAMVETSMVMNGRKRNYIEPCQSMDFEPTALKFRKQMEQEGVFGARDMLIGNLRVEMVQEILCNLTEKGYYSFLGFDVQQARFFEDAILDKGKSAPYILTEYCSFAGIGTNGIGKNFSADSEDKEPDEECSCEYDEDDDEFYDYYEEWQD